MVVVLYVNYISKQMSIKSNHFFKEKINNSNMNERQREGEGYGAKVNDQLTLRSSKALVLKERIIYTFSQDRIKFS